MRATVPVAPGEADIDQPMDVEQLRELPPLDGISDEGLALVAACAAEVTREAGQVLALPDDPGSGMYVIREGTVAVELRTGTIELGPGDFFGELALLVEDGTRVARVRATSEVHCVSIPREDFLELVETEPAFALHLLRELARRLVESRATA